MTGYTLKSKQIRNHIKHYSLLNNEQAVSRSDAFHAIRDNAELRKLLSDTVIGSGYAATRFETPAVTTESLRAAFEFVLVDSPGLARDADPSSFAKQFESNDPNQSVIAFPNLRSDATMIVPRPHRDTLPYTHLLDFIRSAPEDQVHELWKLVAKTMLEEINEAPIWLSTAGGGVPWLHVRLDTRPKYYNYQPYTADPI